MVPSCRGEVVFIAVVRNEGIHQCNGRRFVVERALVHDLDAQAFVQRQKLRTETIYALLLGRSGHRPVEIGLRYEVRQAYHGYPVESLLARIVYAIHPVLPPKALKWRNHILEESIYLMAGLTAHPKRIRHSIEDFDCLLVGTSLFVGIPLPLHRNVVGTRDIDNPRSTLWHIELLVFLLEIKCHDTNLQNCVDCKMQNHTNYKYHNI